MQYIYYCFRQNSNDIKEISIPEVETSWESVRQRIHEIHFGSFRKLVNKVSLSKYLSGICHIKAFLGTHEPSTGCITLTQNCRELGPGAVLISGSCLVICRTAPPQEMIARETKLYYSIRRTGGTLCPGTLCPDDEPKFMSVSLSTLMADHRNTALYRDMVQIYHMCRREGQNYRTEMAALSSVFYSLAAPADVPLAPPAPVKRASGIPSSLLRPAIGDTEKKNAMLNAQGNLVVYRN